MSQVRPFKIQISDQALAELRTKLQATRWIGDVFGDDWRYGAPLPFVRSLCDHWLNVFDWRALEARINREPHIVTEIEGLTIHSVHRRSTRPDAVPLLLLHGWPSSFLEFLDLYDPLSEPPAGEPAFHAVTPSLPGYDFSTTKPGVTPQRIAPMLVTLMERLGYPRFMVHGGNWGAVIGREMAAGFPERLVGLHLSSVNGSPPPDRDRTPLTAQEQAWIDEQKPPAAHPHFAVLSQEPAAIAHAFNDSPAGLAAWVGERLHDWADNRHGFGVSIDRMVGIIALYWFTGSIGSSGLLYYETRHQPAKERFVAVPTAAAIFPKGLIRIPRAWAERHYNIVQWNLFDRGGHFPPMEAPDLVAADLRHFVKTLRANENAPHKSPPGSTR